MDDEEENKAKNKDQKVNHTEVKVEDDDEKDD